MNILAFETSCDETSAALVRDGRLVLKSLVASQTEIHAVYGGVVPEIASRKHIETILPLTRDILDSCPGSEPDAVAVTAEPGLIGALLVGVGFAKAYAFAKNLPLIPVHHIKAHVAGAYLTFPELEPPFLALVVSGGHTLLLEVSDYTKMRTVATTVDDAAGEAFDKIARVMGLGYPGGPAVSALAKNGDNSLYSLPSAMPGEVNMSFSGLKTAVMNIVNTASQKGEEPDKASLAACFERAVCETLVPRAKFISDKLGLKKVVLAGGVAANRALREAMRDVFGDFLYVPSTELCGDNAAMVGSAGYYEYLSGSRAGLNLNARATSKL